ncbi:MAG TPA: sortase [Candidatus Saccharimonadales bacterium]|nr:sortase [Candidatus Saccharimonadales bacterium]
MSTNPLIPQPDEPAKDPAVELIRSKVSRAYAAEPDAMRELAEVQAEGHPSKHQRFMQDLSSSGKSLAEIQTAWHHYYTTLTDPEKHEVWQEFYEANRHTPYQKYFQGQGDAQQAFQPAPMELLPQPAPAASGVVVADHSPVNPPTAPRYDRGSARQLKNKLVSTINANGKLSTKHHLQSLGFGLLTGTIVLVIFLFTFFNDAIIAPFIQPSRKVSSTPIIFSDGTVAADAPPSVTVPKINIQIPIDFTLNSYDETVIENSLKGGAIHYPNTVFPGQNGNAAYFGHSSGNIFNNGKYKFAFTLLHDLTTGDLFYITYGGKTYAYRIFDRAVVPPTDVAVINDTRGKQATAELITCDPPGISTNRLVIWGEQISPSTTTNTAAAPSTVQGTPTVIADNGPSLWSRFVNWVEFWN